MNTELVDILLEKNEWQTFDCKRAVIKPAKLLETIVAFANTDGGMVVLGLEDPDKEDEDQRIVGISEHPDNVSEVLKLMGKEIDPPLPKVEDSEIEVKNRDNVDDKLLILRVQKSNDVHSLKNGDTFVRKGRQNCKIGAVEIQRLQYEKGIRKYEDEVSNTDNLNEINRSLLGQFKKDTKGTGDDWQFLKDNGLAIKRGDRYFLTKSGVLLFGNNPTIQLKSKCGIKVTHYFGVTPTYSGEPNFVEKPFTIEGPLINQIQQALDYFRVVVKKSPPKLRGASFKPSLFIPEWAFQEAITNAVIHRNYSIENDIQLRFFDDRIEIESPGTYPGHITVSNIRTERYARNPIMQRTLNRFQESPNLDIGEGVDRMFKIMKENNLYEPLFISPSLKPNSVVLILLNIQRIGYWDTVSKYLDENFLISSQDARNITGVNDSVAMSRLFKTWVEKGLLEKIGRSKKAAHYKKPGSEVPRGLFSKALKIKYNRQK